MRFCSRIRSPHRQRIYCAILGPRPRRPRAGPQARPAGPAGRPPATSAVRLSCSNGPPIMTLCESRPVTPPFGGADGAAAMARRLRPLRPPAVRRRGTGAAHSAQAVANAGGFRVSLGCSPLPAAARWSGVSPSRLFGQGAGSRLVVCLLNKLRLISGAFRRFGPESPFDDPFGHMRAIARLFLGHTTSDAEPTETQQLPGWVDTHASSKPPFEARDHQVYLRGTCRDRRRPRRLARPPRPPESLGLPRVRGQIQGCPREVSGPGGPRRFEQRCSRPGGVRAATPSLDVWHFTGVVDFATHGDASPSSSSAQRQPHDSGGRGRQALGSRAPTGHAR